MSIGIASARGKQWIHTSGSGETSFEALMNLREVNEHDREYYFKGRKMDSSMLE